VRTELTAALTPVLRDLETTGGPRPEVRDEQWSDMAGQLTAYLYRPDGTGQGVFVMAGEARPDQVAAVADQVQEWAVETLWQISLPATWPECPEHPDSHPLAAQRHGDRAVWVCPRSGARICAVGELPPGLPRPGQRSRRRGR
jgi:hypothetical protein